MPPLSLKQIPALYQKALNLQNQRDFAQATQLYRQILQLRPGLAEAHFQLGIISVELHDLPAALAEFKLAAIGKPAELAVWQRIFAVLREMDDAKEFKSFRRWITASRFPPVVETKLLEEFAKLTGKGKPKLRSALPNDVARLVALLARKDFAACVKLAQSLLQAHPDEAVIHSIMAGAQASLGDVQAARSSFERAIALDPDLADGHANFGIFLVHQNEPATGLLHLRHALRLNPNNRHFLEGLALAEKDFGNLRDAITHYRRLVDLSPSSVEYRRQLVSASIRANRASAVIDVIKSLATEEPTPQNRTWLGIALNELGDSEASLETFESVLADDPNFTQALAALGSYYQFEGDFDKAEIYMRKLIALEPTAGENYRILTTVKKLPTEDPLVGTMVELFDNPKTASHDRMHLGFGLSKVMEDNREYRRVFPYLNVANSEMAANNPWDLDQRRKHQSEMFAAFDKLDFEAEFGAKTSSFDPIFVTGLPRSGTTLVEQIVASHSAVSGTGESGVFYNSGLKFFEDLAKRARSDRQISSKELANIGTTAETQMRELYHPTDRLTDKGITTYLFAGLARLVLPKSRMVVVRRDPRDNLLSIYKNLFVQGTHRYAYSMQNLADSYRLFIEALDYWRDRAPGCFYEIQYEDLVSDLEVESRKLIAACGLEWEDQCLNFHANSRQIRTLSSFQARQPIYQGSRQAWKRYEDDLKPLIAALEKNGDL